MKNLILFSVFCLASLQIFAADITIVDVRRNITLSDEDPVYKDFYLNAGESAGLKKNLVVNVKRRVYVKDSNSKSVGDFETTVGQLRIVQVDGKVAVAREYKLFSRDEEAMIEQIGLMTGDRVDLGGAFIDNTKPATKKKVAEVEVESVREPAAAPEAAPTVKESPMMNAIPLQTPQI
jgi:hypothetical protein